MPYMIDGHNLIGHLTDIALDDPNDEALLVQKLTGFVARTKKQCVVVFDYGLPGGKSRMSTRAVQVVFASQRSSADRVMMERINKLKNPRDWTAVTSDNEVQEIARLRKMQVMDCAAFAVLLQSPPKPVVDAGEASDVNLSEAEVNDWLDFFNNSGGK